VNRAARELIACASKIRICIAGGIYVCVKYVLEINKLSAGIQKGGVSERGLVGLVRVVASHRIKRSASKI